MDDYFVMFAKYNAWANDKLYNAAAKLSNEQYYENRGAFFGSVHGTLNHILVADRLWMSRFTGTGTPPVALNTILYDDLPSLQAAREIEDKRIIDWVSSLSESDLQSSFSYKRATTNDVFEQGYISALAHFFNHQTHHRGQAHALLTSLVGVAPELDLLFFQRVNGIGRKVEA